MIDQDEISMFNKLLYTLVSIACVVLYLDIMYWRP